MTSLVERTGEPDAALPQSLGARLRALRKERGMSARSLAKVLGISASAVSQIERDVMQPSVSRLIAITDALGVPLAAVFGKSAADTSPGDAASATDPTDLVVTRADQSAPIMLESGVTFRRLSPQSTAGLDFFESVYPPGGAATGETDLFRHEGYEIGNIVSGELTIEFDDETVVLSPGDSISYPCSRAHRIRNTTSRPAVATWLIVHR